MDQKVESGKKVKTSAMKCSRLGNDKLLNATKNNATKTMLAF